MAAIAAFAASPQARTLVNVADRFNLDPAVVAGITNTYVAYNFRAALLVHTVDVPAADAPAADDWETAAAANEREWLTG